MKRLIAILGLAAAMALSIGGASVLADEGGSQGDNNAACTTPGATGSGDESGGGDRMTAADHENGTDGSDDMNGTSSGDDENGGRGNEGMDGNGGEREGEREPRDQQESGGHGGD